MSTPRSRRKRNARIERLALLVALLAAGGAAHAMKSDRDQVVNVNSDSSVMSQDNHKVTLTGHVRMDQGTLHADGDNAVGTFDQDNQIQRVVLTGKPAHMQQKMDDGSLVHGQAATIDYTVSENTVTLTGDAVVVHEGQGEFHGAKLTYNTDSGQIIGEGGAGGQVHMILQPKQHKPAAPKPKTTAPAPASTAAPATASSAGH